MHNTKFSTFTSLHDLYNKDYRQHTLLHVVKHTFDKYFKYYNSNTNTSSMSESVEANTEMLNKLCTLLELKNLNVMEKDKQQVLFSAACFLYIGLFNNPPTTTSKYAILNNYLDSEDWSSEVYLQLLSFTLTINHVLDTSTFSTANDVTSYYFNLISIIINSDYINIAKRCVTTNIVADTSKQYLSKHIVKVNGSSILDYNIVKEHFKNNLKSLI